MIIDKTRLGLAPAFLLLALLLTIAVPAIFAKSVDMPLTGSKEAVALFKLGREKAENLEDPGTLFDQAIQKDPTFAFAYLSAGQTNLEVQKNLEMAVSLADKASPGEREWILAARDQNSGNTAGQLSHLQQLVKLFPRDKRAHTQLGFYYRGVGDEPAALLHFNQAAKIDKNWAPVYNNIGYSNMALAKYGDAEAAFKTYIKLIPNNPNPYDSYAEMLMTTGRYDDSIKQYNMALAKDPTFIASYRGIGNNYGYKGDYDKSRETYGLMFSKATNDGNRDQALLSTMNSWLAQGKYSEALEVNARRIAAAGDAQTQIGLHNLAGFINVEANNLDAALVQFEMASKLQNHPSLALALKGNREFNQRVARARYLAMRDDFAGAQTELNLATGRNVNQQRAFNQVSGILALRQKDYAKASEFFAKANPADPYVWYYQAVALEGTGDEKGAITLYQRIADHNQLDATGYAIVRPRAMAKLKK